MAHPVLVMEVLQCVCIIHVLGVFYHCLCSFLNIIIFKLCMPTRPAGAVVESWIDRVRVAVSNINSSCSFIGV